MTEFLRYVIRTARVIVFVLLVLFCLLFLGTALARLPYPYEIEWNEGGVLCHALMAARGHLLYVPPNAGFFPWTYTPLYYYLLAAVSFVTGLHFWVGRAISIIATLVSALLLYRIVERETRRGEAGFVAASLFLAAYGITGFWYDLVRMDSAALALVLGGFFLIRFGRRRGWIAAAALFSLAVFTKQNMLVFYPFVIVCAFLENRREAPRFTGALLLFSAIPFAFFEFLSRGWFSAYAFAAPVSHGFRPAEALRSTSLSFISGMPLFAVSFVVLAAAALRRAPGRERSSASLPWLTAFLGAFACYAATQSHPGAYRNVAIPAVLFGALLSGLLWARAADCTGRGGLAARGFLCALVLAQLWIFRYDPLPQIPRRADYRAGRDLIARLEKIPGDILMEYHPFYPVMAGKPPGFHADALFDHYFRGRRKKEGERLPQDLMDKIENREYAAIILDEPPAAMDLRSLAGAIERNYVLTERLFPEGTRRFCTRTGWIVRPDLLYEPKGRGRKELRRRWPLEGEAGRNFIRLYDQFATDRIKILPPRHGTAEAVMKSGELRGAVMTGSESVINDEYRLIYNFPNYGFLTDWVRVPRSASLKFGIGFWQKTAIRSTNPAVFAVTAVERSGARRPLFRGSFNTQEVAEYSYQRWEEVDLSKIAGKEVRFEFTVGSPKPGNPAIDWPVWLDPCIVYPALEKKASPVQTGKTNVIIILADALRPDHLSCYGYGRETSPHLDNLASRGAVFLNAYPQAPWTKPSVGSLFTSFYPFEHRALLAVDVPQYRVVPSLAHLSDEFETLAEVFKRNGYITAGFNTNVHLLRSLGFAQGFDYWADMDNISSAEVMDDVVRWIGSHAASPFYVYIHFMDTHSPYKTVPPHKGRFHGLPPGFYDRPLTEHDYRELIDGVPDSGEMEMLSDIINKYDDAVAQTDSQVGRLVSLLDSKGLRNNTLIIFLSDHGEALSEHGNYFHGWTLYDEMLKVPLIISGPGLVKEGLSPGNIVETRDVFPTLVDLLDLESAAMGGNEIKRRSWEKALAEARDETPGFAYGETEIRIQEKPLRVRSRLSSVQNRKWKLIHDSRENSFELYNIEKDPGETINLYGKYPRIEENLEKVLKERGKVTLPGKKKEAALETGAVLREQLRALGYLR